MGTITEGTPDKDPGPDLAYAMQSGQAAARSTPARQSLPPKGSCWYCEKPLDSVKRFCGKGCADAFDEEAEFSR